MKLGHTDEGLECYRNYESFAGPDRIARKRLLALVPDSEFGE